MDRIKESPKYDGWNGVARAAIESEPRHGLPIVSMAIIATCVIWAPAHDAFRYFGVVLIGAIGIGVWLSHNAKATKESRLSEAVAGGKSSSEGSS